jgi:uncharacterized tellurite resistance protein B-like protein
MRDLLRNIFGGLRAGETPARFQADDERLALAALLIHCTVIDGSVSATENEKLRALLRSAFGLSGSDLDSLLEEALAAEREAVDLYRFTSVLKRQMSEEKRIQVVEQLWEIAFADGASHEFEENLIWRVAELLGVHRRDRIARKRAVAENKPAGREDGG